MHQFSYARGVFAGHLVRAGFVDKAGNADRVVMELGPGESLFSALLARSYGFKSSILVDVDDFTTPSIEDYRKMAAWLAEEGVPCPSIEHCDSISSILKTLNSSFFTNGLNSLSGIPDESVDLIFSHTVFQHIKRTDFTKTISQIWRILKPGGISTHVIDFKDMFSESLNHLRFSRRIWESKTFHTSGFYTNRFRFGEMVHIIEGQGFKVDVLEKSEWAQLPIQRKDLDSDFKTMPDSELLISSASIRLLKTT